RHAAATGPNPGVTRHQKWIKLGKDVELLDTPGILWPKLDQVETGWGLAITGAIKDKIVGEERLSLFLIQYLQSHYPLILEAHYQLGSACDVPVKILEALAWKRGCLIPGGEPDLTRAAKLLLQDFRAGKLGQVSFETPPI
ncbi:MAG: ribosome biogenesis GTPase YlqF, partial [SAR324 cluster bacterium]|nr:ribosome biogenesis GTPase YlqF [SAR324 cluster bacterium]